MNAIRKIIRKLLNKTTQPTMVVTKKVVKPSHLNIQNKAFCSKSTIEHTQRKINRIRREDRNTN